MLKQSSSRNLRTKGFKLKHVFQVFALFLICLWLIYQVKQSYSKSKVESLGEKSVKGQQDLQKVVKLGRKDLNPLLLDELAAEFQRPPDEDLEQEELDEVKNHENGGDDDNDGVGEHEQLEDIIDEDDKDATRRDAV
ncbi:putative EPIDERMAL PATTERNING FACTOR-like protein 2-like [Capsicum annuum]|nr:putative EPIDERMAL PATTERNING FACTOR-like protein 2-like [Capsicum annuum]